MTSQKRLGLIVGLLLILQGVSGYVSNFVLLRPVLRASGGFFANAALSEFQVRLAVLVSLAAGAITLGIAITVAPIFRRQSESLALWFVSLSVVAFATVVVENIGLLTMLSVSQKIAAATAEGDLLRTIGSVAAAARNAAHYTNLLVVGGMILVMYGTLFRYTLVPRALAAFGVFAALLQISAIMMPMLGRPMMLQLLSPLGLAQLALALWLVVRGFKPEV